MIVIDTSALVAILTGEPEAETFEQLLAVHTALAISAATWVEATMVCWGRIPDGIRRLRELRVLLSIEQHPLDAAQADIATDAFIRFGRGSNSPAKLNLGDCFSYALAKSLGAPLLYKGDDFVHTDIRPALGAR